MKLAIAALVSLLAIEQASACSPPPETRRHVSYQGGGGTEAISEEERGHGPLVPWMLLGVVAAAAAVALGVRPRVAE